MILDLLLDLSNTTSSTSLRNDLLPGIDSLQDAAALIGRFTCILPPETAAPEQPPPDWRFFPADSARAASNTALRAAARERCSLLVILGYAIPGKEAISVLCQALESDPMFSFAMARPADKEGNLLRLSLAFGDSTLRVLPGGILAHLPESYIVPEVIPCCFVVRREIVMNFGDLAAGFQSTAGAWLHYLCRARRAGFRGIVSNRAVVPACDLVAATLTPPPADYWTLHREYFDSELARQEFGRLAAHQHEALLSCVLSPDPAFRKTLLLDCRVLLPSFNGTTAAILGILHGLAALDLDWSITLLVKPAAIQIHNLYSLHPEWKIVGSINQDQHYSVALHPSQPWGMRTLIDLHRHALFNFYYMLDTIAWDSIYSLPPSRNFVEEAWQFVADYADGILYQSDYTRRRVAMRFPPAPETRHYVCYHSFHPDEYVRPVPKPSDAAEEYLLLVGNRLDHKWMKETLELLATAFPFCPLKALGCSQSPLQSVTALPSGSLPDSQVDELYAHARIIVFPSFYEGFGFPIVKGLHYGKPVIARRSPLLSEIASRCQAPGSLYAFEDPLELIEIVSKLLRAEPLVSLPLGQAEPLRWKDAARQLMMIFETELAAPHNSRWLARERALRRIMFQEKLAANERE